MLCCSTTNSERLRSSLEIVTADGFRFTIRHSYSLGWEPGAKGTEWPETACIILRLGKEDYLVIGSGVVVTFQQRIGLAKCEEVEIVDGKQRIIRHLNGDQTHQGRHVRFNISNYTDTDEKELAYFPATLPSDNGSAGTTETSCGDLD